MRKTKGIECLGLGGGGELPSLTKVAARIERSCHHLEMRLELHTLVYHSSVNVVEG